MSSSGALGVGGKRDELRLLINSRNPIITVETAEEERLAHLLTALAVELCDSALHLERDDGPGKN